MFGFITPLIKSWEIADEIASNRPAAVDSAAARPPAATSDLGDCHFPSSYRVERSGEDSTSREFGIIISSMVRVEVLLSLFDVNLSLKMVVVLISVEVCV